MYFKIDIMSDIKYRNYNIKDTNKVLKLWNDEIGYIYPITKEMFNQNINNCKYFDNNVSFVAYIDNKIVGFLLGKVYDNNPLMSKYIDTSFISLIYVSRNYRKNGIGSELLNKYENSLKDKKIKKIMLGSDLDNFFPGIPNDFDNLTDVFFRKRGFQVTYYTHDLVKKLTKHDVVLYNVYANNNKTNYEIRYCTKDDEEKVKKFFEKCFYGRWYNEAIEYFENGEFADEYLIALDNDRVIGFLRLNKQRISKISYNIMWSKRFKKLYGVGPLGVDSEYRKQGIATMLLMKGIADGAREGFSHAMIDWTGLVSYYQKFGFETWKCYQYANKNLD